MVPVIIANKTHSIDEWIVAVLYNCEYYRSTLLIRSFLDKKEVIFQGKGMCTTEQTVVQ